MVIKDNFLTTGADKMQNSQKQDTVNEVCEYGAI